MVKGVTERRLEDLQRQLRAARESERILVEQVAAWDDSLEDTRIRALVSETPLQSAEYEDLARHVHAARRELTRRREEIAELTASRDQLLREWTPRS